MMNAWFFASNEFFVREPELTVNIEAKPNCSKKIHKIFLCVNSLIKKLEFLSHYKCHYSYPKIPSPLQWCPTSQHMQLTQLYTSGPLLDSSGFRALCLQWLSSHFPESQKPFLTVSAPGCHSLCLKFTDPFSYLCYSLFHVSLPCLSSSKRQKQCGFSLIFHPEPTATLSIQQMFVHVWCMKGHQCNLGKPLRGVVLSPHKLFHFGHPPNMNYCY